MQLCQIDSISDQASSGITITCRSLVILNSRIHEFTNAQDVMHGCLSSVVGAALFGPDDRQTDGRQSIIDVPVRRFIARVAT